MINSDKIEWRSAQLMLAFSSLLLISNISFSQDTLRVFFIGNSYTGANDLPFMTQRAAEVHGDVLIYDQNLAGGQTLEGHWNNRVGLIASMTGREWDYVVMQEQSQRPAFSPSQVERDVFPYAHKLDSLFKNQFECIQSGFYMTWGRKNGDPSNCPFYTPICTYAGMQARLRESYIQMANDNNAICLPVGEVWKHVRDSLPGIELYTSDGSHPSEVGSFIAASTIYSSLFHKAYTDSIPIVPMSFHFDQLAVQQFVTPTVFDSLETWNNDKNALSVSYSDSVSGNVLSLNMNATNADFLVVYYGDGMSDTIYSMDSTYLYTYAQSGFYEGAIELYRGCESSSEDMWITIGPMRVQENAFQFSEAEYIKVFGLNGQLILEGLSTILEKKRYLQTGIYVLEVRRGDAVMRRKVFRGQD